MTYDQFKKSNIDLSLLGLEQRDTEVTYYCTPRQADIIGWAGVDGIHYCTIPGFGDLIFAVSPMNAGDCVHPIARCFEDLLRLLLTCTDMAALEQCYAWDEEQFKAFLIDCPATEEQRAVLEALENEFGLEPIDDVFHYVKELQAEFDLSTIPYTEDYYDPEMNAHAPEQPVEWQVFYDGGYWTKNGEDPADEELKLDRYFSWGEERWYIPSLYLCEKGLVIEFCVGIDPLGLKSFFDKWTPLLQGDEEISQERQEQINRENPLVIEFHPTLSLNGRALRTSHGASVSWIPEGCTDEDTANSKEARRLLEHYGLDASRAWSFHRWSCPWGTEGRPVIRTLHLRLERRLTAIEGIHFKNPSVGNIISFVHPVTGAEHKLTVLEYEQQELEFSSEAFAHGAYEYPTHCTSMTYALAPDLPDMNFQIRDCLDNDEPVRKTVDAFEPKATCDACMVGIIGGADGPTALVFSQSDETKAGFHTVLSALHFEPTDDVEWKSIFREKLMQDRDVDLIG